MRYRPLGSTGLTVSEIGFGCASWWGKPAFDERDGAGAGPRGASTAASPCSTPGASYSAGEAEPRLGRALKGRDASRPGDRHQGRHLPRRAAAGSRATFARPPSTASAERSLRNLGLEILPLLQLHGPAIGELTDELLDGAGRR